MVVGCESAAVGAVGSNRSFRLPALSPAAVLPQATRAPVPPFRSPPVPRTRFVVYIRFVSDPMSGKWMGGMRRQCMREEDRMGQGLCRELLAVGVKQAQS